MNELQLFNFNGSNIRTLMIEGEPYFIGNDIAEVLGYSNKSKAILKHVDEEDRKILKSQNGSLENVPNRGLTIINESGLYSLIISSKLPQAKDFKRWVTSEVLPTIRKTGSYGNNKFNEFANLPLDQQLLQIAGAQSERLDKVEAQVTDLVGNRRIDSDEYNAIKCAVAKKVSQTVKTRGWNYKRVSKPLFQELNGAIKRVFNAANRGMLKAKDYQNVLDFINDWEPSTETTYKIKQTSLFD